MVWACEIALVLCCLGIATGSAPTAGWSSGSAPTAGWSSGSAPATGWASGSAPTAGWSSGSAPTAGWSSGSAPANGWSSGSAPTAGWSSGSAPANGWSSGSALDYVSRYSGPTAVPVVLPDGTLANTPEVAAARAQHQAALNKAKALWYGSASSGHSSFSGWPPSSSSSSAWSSSSGAWPSSSGGWAGPQASPSVLATGHLADTPDVANARAAHLGALAKAHEEAEKWKLQGHGWS